MFYQHNDEFFAALQNGNGLVVSRNQGDDCSAVELDDMSDIQNLDIGFIINMEQNPYSSDLELWVSSYSGLYRITESHISGRYHCVEVTASGLPDKFTGWSRAGDPDGAKTMLDSITYSSPPGALRLDFDGGAKAGYWHTRWRRIKVIPSTRYTISGKIKTEGLESSGYAGAYILVEDSQGPMRGRWTNRVNGT